MLQEPTDGLVTLEWADAYFGRRLGAGDLWEGLETQPKRAALLTAQDDLETVFGTLRGNDPTRRAICEQALFRLTDPALDRRAALRAQGVAAAGVVGETYRAGGGQDVPICGVARRLLGGAESVYAGQLVRDPDDVLER